MTPIYGREHVELLEERRLRRQDRDYRPCCHCGKWIAYSRDDTVYLHADEWSDVLKAWIGDYFCDETKTTFAE